MEDRSNHAGVSGEFATCHHEEMPWSPADQTSEPAVPANTGNTNTHDPFAHLAPRVVQWLGEGAAQRMARVMSDVQILYPTLQGLLNEVEWLIQEPRRQRARGLVICGEPGSGKTVLASIIQNRYPVDRACVDEHGRPHSKVLAIQMSGARTTKAVLNRILAATQSPISQRTTIGDQERLVIETLRRMNCGLLILDEMQDILQAPEREQTRVLEVIKLLMNSLSMPILALGPDNAATAFRADPHLEARFKVLTMGRWKEGEELGVFLAALERHLPLKKPSHLEKMQKVLVKASQGRLAEMLERIRVAAINAIVSGEERILVGAIEAPIARPSIDRFRPK